MESPRSRKASVPSNSGERSASRKRSASKSPQPAATPRSKSPTLPKEDRRPSAKDAARPPPRGDAPQQSRPAPRPSAISQRPIRSQFRPRHPQPRRFPMNAPPRNNFPYSHSAQTFEFNASRGRPPPMLHQQQHAPPYGSPGPLHFGPISPQSFVPPGNRGPPPHLAYRPQYFSFNNDYPGQSYRFPRRPFPLPVPSPRLQAMPYHQQQQQMMHNQRFYQSRSMLPNRPRPIYRAQRRLNSFPFDMYHHNNQGGGGGNHYGNMPNDYHRGGGGPPRPYSPPRPRYPMGGGPQRSIHFQQRYTHNHHHPAAAPPMYSGPPLRSPPIYPIVSTRMPAADFRRFYRRR